MEMPEVLEESNVYLAELERIEREAASPQRSWLAPLRRAALTCFEELGFPTIRDEEWRFTNIAPIASTPFAPARACKASFDGATLARLCADGLGYCSLVFVNGLFDAARSRTGDLPAGTVVCSLAEAVGTKRELVREHLGHYAAYKEQALTALNTALWEDGAFIYVPRGTVVTMPIHLVFVSTGSEEPVMAHPRNLVLAGATAEVTVIERYVGLGRGTYWTNGVTELVAEDGANVDHYKVVEEADDGYHTATTQIWQGRSSQLRSHTITLDGALVRNDLNAVLGGEGADCILNGSYMVSGATHVDNHLRVEHAQAHCNSWEYFKGILDGAAKGVFTGRIIVRKGAQKTDAKQTNMSLLLSPTAQVESKPQLEIFADDVKCTHGATIGQVSDEALFYLRTRGMDEKAARGLLVYAFVAENIEKIRVPALRRQIEAWMQARLGGGLTFKEAV